MAEGFRGYVVEETSADDLIGIPYGTRESWGDALLDPRMRSKAVAAVETMIRTSWEYKRYVQWLRREVRLDECALLRGVTASVAKVEFHHYPFTLYEIVDTEIAHLEQGQEEFSRVKVAGRVARLHYDGLVGLVPLSKTMHELAHEGKLSIPPEAVFGDVRGYLAARTNALPRALLARAMSKLRSGESKDEAARTREEIAVKRTDRLGAERDGMFEKVDRALSGNQPTDRPDC